MPNDPFVLFSNSLLSVISNEDGETGCGSVIHMRSKYTVTTQRIGEDNAELMLCVYIDEWEEVNVADVFNLLFPELNGVFDVISDNAIILRKKEAFIFAIKYGI